MLLVSWNVEDLRRHDLPGVLAELGAPDVLCLQEVRVRDADHEARQALERALPGYVCGMSLNRDMQNARFRGGRSYGVATFVKEELAPSFRVLPWDREGRIVVATLADVVVVNLYAVNGTSKPYLDPASGEVHGTRFDFKRAFQRLLAREIAPYAERVVAIGDWNVSQARIDIHPRLRTEEPHAVARRELAEIVSELDLVDVFRARNPDARAYTWFNRRARGLDAARVDFALVGRALLPRVTDAEVLALREGSDHAPITLRLD